METRTMNVIVIYHSKFGNTERIAKAIGCALADEFTVRVQSVDETATIPREPFHYP